MSPSDSDSGEPQTPLDTAVDEATSVTELLAHLDDHTAETDATGTRTDSDAEADASTYTLADDPGLQAAAEALRAAQQQTTDAAVHLTTSHGCGDDLQSKIGRRHVDHEGRPPSPKTISPRGHMLFSGVPRQGKTASLVNVARRLHQDHDYTYLHVFDDGRNETAMAALPTPVPGTRAALEAVGEEPAGMAMEVFVPATAHLPDYLPENFTPFTLSHTAIPDAFQGTATWDVLSDAGLITSHDAPTNIAIEDVIADGDQAASLFIQAAVLPERVTPASVRLALADVWLEAAYRARDADPSLPRVALGVDALQDAAPAVLEDRHPCPDVVRSLRDTIRKLVVQGDARGLTLLAATQAPHELWKPVRENFATTCIFRSDQTSLRALSGVQHVDPSHLQRLDRGAAVVVDAENDPWTAEFLPAPCAIGAPNSRWRDVYGRHAGARVVPTGRREENVAVDAEWWVTVGAAEVVRDRQPRPGEWYLLPEDFDVDEGDDAPPLSVAVDEDGTREEFLDRGLVEDALRLRCRDITHCYPLAPVDSSST